MVKWGVDVSTSQKVLGLRVLMDEASGNLEIFFKTPEGETLCTKLSAHSLTMKKAARQRERAETEKLRASQNDLSPPSLALDESIEMDVSEPELPLSPPSDASTTVPAAPAAPAGFDTADAADAADAAPAPAPMGPPTLHLGVHSEMDASLRATVLSAQKAYVVVAASAAGVDGAEVPRCGREAYIALHRVYNCRSLPDVPAEPEYPVVQIPLPPVEVGQLPAPQPAAALAEPQPALSDPTPMENDDDEAFDDGNGTATSGTDSEEDLVPPGPEEQSWEKAAMELRLATMESAAPQGDGEPQLSTYYSDSMPTVRATIQPPVLRCTLSARVGDTATTFNPCSTCSL